jgi:hypothetical protein
MTQQSLRLAALALLLLWPRLGGAADLTLSGEVQSEYDDNVFRSERNPDDDVGFRIVPGVKLHEDRGQDFLYSLEYEVPLEFYVDNGDELDDVDHFATGRATYHVSDRTEIFARDRFGYLRGRQRDVRVEDVTGTRINTERDRVTRNDAQLGIEHQISPRLLTTARVSHELFEIDRDDRADNWLLDANVDLLYALTPKHQVGGGVRYIRQEFDDTTEVTASELNTINVFAEWLWQIDETLDLSVAAGPSWIDNQQDDPRPVNTTQSQVVPFSSAPIADATGLGFVDRDGNPATGPYNAGTLVTPQFAACPTVVGPPTIQVEPCALSPNLGNPGVAGVLLDPVTDAGLIATLNTPVLLQPNTRGDDSQSLDVFGQVVLRKRWTPNFQSALRYSRTQAGASGLGGGVIRDEVSLANNWDITERWQLFARADWSLRQTINDATSTFTQVQADPIGGVSYAERIQITGVSGGANEIDTQRWGVAGRITHLLTRRTSAWVQVAYNEQDSQGGTRGAGSDFTNFLASVGVRHVFEPIKLW